MRDFVRGKEGFTLLEVLVSVALLAMAVTVVLQLFSSGLRAISASEDYVAASNKANAVMREVLDDEKLSENSWSERTDDGYRVDVTVAESEKERTENLQVKLLEVTVTVAWAKGTRTKSLTLKTFKMMSRQI